MIRDIINDLNALNLFTTKEVQTDNVEILFIDYPPDVETEFGTITPTVFTSPYRINEYEITFNNLETVKEEFVDVVKFMYIDKIIELSDRNRTNFDESIVRKLETIDFSPTDWVSNRRRIVAKVNNASNLIATDARIGPAQFIFMDDGFVFNPKTANSLDITYMDKHRTYKDGIRVILGRKNSIDQQGVHFLINPDSFEIDEENNTLRVKMRFIETGFHPEKNFIQLRFNIDDPLIGDDDSQFEDDFEE